MDVAAVQTEIKELKVAATEHEVMGATGRMSDSHAKNLNLSYASCSPTLWIDQNEDQDMVYINLLENRERFTGYSGPLAARIWAAIYNENCFQSLRSDMCLEERVFYRLISGLQTSITTHIAHVVSFRFDLSHNTESRIHCTLLRTGRYIDHESGIVDRKTSFPINKNSSSEVLIPLTLMEATRIAVATHGDSVRAMACMMIIKSRESGVFESSMSR